MKNISMASCVLALFVAHAAHAAGPYSLWSTSDTPAAIDPETNSVELGVQFTASVNGLLSAVKFYRGANTNQTHTISVWSSTGVLLARTTYVDSSTSAGWRTATLPSPLRILAGTTYTASYHTAGQYPYTHSGYATQRSSPPLSAPVSAGVFTYGSSPVQPTSVYLDSNYYVDVSFTSTEHSLLTGTTPDNASFNDSGSYTLGVQFKSDVNAELSAIRFYTTNTTSRDYKIALWSDTGGSALASRTVTVAATSGWNTISFTSPVTLTAGTVYRASIYWAGGFYPWTPGRGRADSGPLHATTGVYASGDAFPGNNSGYGGSYGVDVVVSGTQAWPTTLSSCVPSCGPGGPILVVASNENPYSTYLAEILRAEGLNEFSMVDASTVTSTLLSSYDTVIVGAIPLTAAAVDALTTWVNGGGNLIALKPDPQLLSLLGITSASGTRSNAYVKIDTTTGTPGAGLTSASMQYHGTADLYTANTGTTAVAALWSDASTATSNPAVTLRSVGSSGGQAAAFTYDLALSVAQTRQGNPLRAGIEGDGATDTLRSADLFAGGWLDISKVGVPQADEQQRLLANLVISMTRDRKALPRLWYLPRGHKAAFVMTGDDHANNGTEGRFNGLLSQDPSGCAVDRWECIRATSYLYPGTIASLSNTTASSFISSGFEIADHIAVDGASGCSWPGAALSTNFASSLSTFTDTSHYPSASPVVTERNHCIVWGAYSQQAEVASANGIKLDTNYYHYPRSFFSSGGVLQNGFMNGGGLPQRFVTEDGRTVDVFQAVTQITDENQDTNVCGDSRSCSTTTETTAAANSFMDNAYGSNGYYGVITVMAHTDVATHPRGQAVITAAQSHSPPVPIISAKQLLTWLNGREATTFSSLAWNSTTRVMSFTLGLNSGAANMAQVLVPKVGPSGTNIATNGITRSGTTVSYTLTTVKGIDYAVFDVPSSAASYSYQVQYQ